MGRIVPAKPIIQLGNTFQPALHQSEYQQGATQTKDRIPTTFVRTFFPISLLDKMILGLYTPAMHREYAPIIFPSCDDTVETH